MQHSSLPNDNILLLSLFFRLHILLKLHGENSLYWCATALLFPILHSVPSCWQLSFSGSI